MRYKPAEVKPQITQIVGRMQELSKSHPRWGYRLVHGVLRREFGLINPKKVYRLWREHGFAVPRKRVYKRRYCNSNRHMSAISSNSIWAFDFVFDECANGQKLKCFAVKDEFTRECLGITVEARMRSSAVIGNLERMCVLHGQPDFMRCDNGPEFIFSSIKKWALQRGICLAYTDPGKPWQNGSAESFNSCFRNECLNAELFSCRAEARVVIEEWRKTYNELRPHSALGYRTPAEVRRQSLSACQIRKRPAIPAAA